MSKSKKKTTSRSKIGKKELRSTVSHFLSSHPGAYFTPKQLFKALKFTTHPLKMLCIDVLNEMIDSQDIVVNEDGEFS
ncbi:MAG: ribonuclease R, partial [Bacteroidaceae bacterium]|nr:ribonuclease R [Bacteroidaceae bacterium]